MPSIIGWATLRGSKHANLLQLDLWSLTVRGLAPKFSKRTILAGLILFPCRARFFRTFSLKDGKMVAAEPRGHGCQPSLNRYIAPERSLLSK